MLPSASSPAPAVRRLAAALYGYAFLGELVLLYPFFALLFRDTGLTVAQISTLFMIWTVAGVVLEVPSGALADTVSRRLLLVVAPLLAAAGFVLWTAVPSYPAFAAGFVLWGAGGALASGTLEALVWTELDRLGATDRYARLTGRARTAELLGVMTAAALAGPVLTAGGHRAVGAASVLACLLAAVVATRLPEHRPTPTPGPTSTAGPTSTPGFIPTGVVDTSVTGSTPTGSAPTGAAPSSAVAAGIAAGPLAGPGGDRPDLGWWGSLRAGVTETRTNPRVRGAVLLVPAVGAVWGALDEYTPLLAVETGVAEATVPLLLLLTWAGLTLGGLLVPAAHRLGGYAQPVLLTVAALALAGGAASGHPAGMALVGVAFCAFQIATVLVDERLQARITGPSRATVTSLAGMAENLATLATYAGYAWAATAYGHRWAFVLAAAPYLVLAAALLFRGRRRDQDWPGTQRVCAAPGGGRLPEPEGTWEPSSSQWSSSR
ncbi:MFS transporter [Micromonospora cathayae]|uniref:MFS transporter n=1 Tax=Micromonospora cathayae TaxID=3028804 RepID=A0ABY7ZJI1_9ACTN|nr:MFS transporter [Micromonospora sp. HUAS 3]WDZ82668.1 MFS transporter [Micromonospora sp. HUAS 3]